MSLDNFQLPPFIVEQLYKNSLVDLDSHQIKNKSLKEKELTFLGNNKKNITVIVNDDDSVYLQEDQLKFLVDILTACKLSLSDIALVNFFQHPTLNLDKINHALKPQKILCLGVTLSDLDFPMQFPDYQVQHYNNQDYLASPSLRQLALNKQEKMQLWTALKKMFSV